MTKPVTVGFELTGAEHDPQGGLRVGFKGNAIINRRDEGVSRGGLLIGRQVVLELDVAVTRRPGVPEVPWIPEVAEDERPVGFRVSVRP